jgi:uncharacterized membrane protein YkoI
MKYFTLTSLEEPVMFKAIAAILPTVLAMLFYGSAMADEKIDVKSLPEKVTKAIQDRLPGAQLLSAEKETDDGKIEYEVKVRHDGNKYEVEVKEDGAIKEVERDDD